MWGESSGYPSFFISIGMIMLTVTIVDGNPINQNALKILLNSIKVFSPSLRKNLIVIYPEGELPISYLKWLSENKVSIYSKKIELRNDIYKVKLLLADFIKANIQSLKSSDLIFYLDPDHILLSKLNIKPKHNTLIVSSEFKKLDDCVKKYFLKNKIDMNHFNTSIIFGSIKTWFNAVNEWEMRYYKIIRDISSRYLEEYSFAYSALKNNVQMIPALNRLQSNFFSPFDEYCTMFHYGGEYPESKKIKLCLRDENNMKKDLLKLLEYSNSKIESWLIKNMYKFL